VRSIWGTLRTEVKREKHRTVHNVYLEWGVASDHDAMDSDDFTVLSGA
jgi:hypothetical protein